MYWLKNTFTTTNKNTFINNTSYSDFHAQIQKYANNLPTQILTANKIALCPKTNETHIKTLLTLLLLEKEILLINSNLALEEKIKQCEHSNITTLIDDENKSNNTKNIKIISHQKLQTNNNTQTPPKLNYTPDTEKTAIIINTTGTTGKAKQIKIKWKHIHAHVQMSAKKLGKTPEDNWLITLPIFHVSGLMIIFRSIYNNTSVTTIEKFTPTNLIKTLETQKITIVSLVPTMLKQIIDEIKNHSLRILLLGGESCPTPLLEKALNKNLPIYKTYGMTQTLGQITTFNLQKNPEKIQSSGTPLDNITIKITEKDQNGIGKILVKTPTLTQNQKNKENEFYDTNDYGYIDQQGYLYIVNRRNDLIISGGENIYPKEIENTLYELPEIKECIILPIDDEKYGQRPILHIVTSLTEKQIINFLETKIAKYKIPDKIILHNALPKNDLGKIDTKLLKEKQKSI